MKNKLSRLFLILGLLTSSCSNTVESKQPESKQVDSSSQLKQAFVPAESNLYKINWSYCAAPGQITSAKEDGCVRSSRPLYFWLKEPGVVPKGILIRRDVPLPAISDLSYQVAIFAQGCFPKHIEVQALDFYSVGRQFSLDKNFVGDRQILEGVELEVKPLSREEANKLLAYYLVNRNRNIFPPGCPSLESEREKLAPYFPQ